MARSMTMAPQAPRPGAGKHPVGKSAAAPHGHPTSFKPAPHHGHGLWAVLALLVLAAAGGGWWFSRGGGPAADPGAQLLAQMEAAAQGTVAPTHAFGGPLLIDRANGRINVIAQGVPSRACVQVGWRLARTGTIIVNGTLSPRLSAAKLSELCSGDDATLLWVPDDEPRN